MIPRDKDGYRILIESPYIAGLLAQARAEAEAEFLLLAIHQHFREFPAELATDIRACVNSNVLARWLRIALGTQTVEQFREQAGL